MLFTVLSPKKSSNFTAQVEGLERQLLAWLSSNQLDENQLVMVRVSLTDAANQLGELRKSSLLANLLSETAVSVVEQPLLDGFKIGLQVWATSVPVAQRRKSGDSVILEAEGQRLVVQTVRFSSENVENLDAEQQTELAFEKHISLLASLGMTLTNDCHRTWIYVRDIDRNYAGVVKGRNDIFAKEGLTSDTHFIASTGIGGNTEESNALVCVDFLSVANLAASDSCTEPAAPLYLKAPDYLNNTAEYGVAFERGTALDIFGQRCRFISGTASIDKHGKCLYHGDVIAQAERLFLNIDQLLKVDNCSVNEMSYFVVYLRDVSDSAAVSSYMRARFPNIPTQIVEARVCRPEWLIEVEGIAAY